MNGFSDLQVVAMLGQHSFWARRACREILRRPADFIPLLLDTLDSAIRNVDDNIDEAFLPASLLLAQVREKRAYPRFAALISYDEYTVEELWGDSIGETVPALLRDTFGGDLALLPRIIEDVSISVWSRIAALNAWGLHYQDGHISREAITGYFRRLLEESPQKPKEPDRCFYGFLASVIADYQLAELIDSVAAVYDRNGIDCKIQGNREEYIRDFTGALYVPENCHIDDAIGELEQLRWFEENQGDNYDDDDL